MTPSTKLGDFGAGSQTTFSAPDVAGDDPACECPDLPDGMNCWICVHREVRHGD